MTHSRKGGGFMLKKSDKICIILSAIMFVGAYIARMLELDNARFGIRNTKETIINIVCIIIGIAFLMPVTKHIISHVKKIENLE